MAIRHIQDVDRRPWDWRYHINANCNDCYTPYPFPLDTRVEDDLWRRISPDGEGNGLLCANCIVARLARLDPAPIVVKMTPVWAEEYE